MQYNAKIAQLIQEKISSLVIDEKEFDGDDTYKFRVVMTDETIDRYTEILKADGIDYDDYLKNPVIIADHNYLIQNIIGKATRILFDAENRRWICEGVFSKTNPLADIARKLYAEGMLKAVSVGLIPKMRDPNNRDIVTKRELLELSFVAVGANPNALSLDEKSYKMAKEAGLIVEYQKSEETYEERLMKTAQKLYDSMKRLDGVCDTIEQLSSDISLIKQHVVDGKTDEQDPAMVDAKEKIQEASRALNEGLRQIKQAMR